MIPNIVSGNRIAAGAMATLAGVAVLVVIGFWKFGGRRPPSPTPSTRPCRRSRRRRASAASRTPTRAATRRSATARSCRSPRRRANCCCGTGWAPRSRCIAHGWSGWDGASAATQAALADAVYALGCGGLLGFDDALAALSRGDTAGAASGVPRRQSGTARNRRASSG